MQNITSATKLLTRAHHPEARAQLLTSLGFTSTPLTLAPDTRTQLGLPPQIIDAAVAKGPASLRALCIQLAHDANPQQTLTKLATSLSTHTPHLRWLTIATQRQTPLLAFATWLPTIPPKLAALITRTTHIVNSDAETFCALTAATHTPHDSIRHQRWLETLGREAITKRFYRAIEHQIDALARALTPNIHAQIIKVPPLHHAKTLATLYTSRLLFLSFLETKGWLNHDHAFLVNGFADCMANGGHYHRRTLEPLFFGTLNTRPSARAARAHAFGKIPFLNGGLFTRTPLERTLRHTTFPDDALGDLYEHVFTRYRFTPHEDSTTWTQAAIDPEMLGKVFESLMAPTDRKHGGAFYTPQPIVERVTNAALTTALQTPHVPADIVALALANRPIPAHYRGHILDHIDTLKILDPACGSGAFLVHTLERLATLRTQLGDPRPMYAIRRALLMSAIYGVDINPTAVWLCELRLWLSVVIDHDEPNPMHVLPLPNLDHNIRTGDALTEGDFSRARNTITSPTPAHQLTTLRLRYARATGLRKKSLARTLDRTERTHTIAHLNNLIARRTNQRKELLCATRTPNLFTKHTTPAPTARRQLTTLRTEIRRLRQTKHTVLTGGALPFAFPSHFPDIAALGGFSIVLGNPPWVRMHNIPPEMRNVLRHNFTTYKHAPWNQGAKQARAASGFAGQIDLAALFIERAIQLLANNGTTALLVPAKLWRSLAGGGTRKLITQHTHLATLEDFSAATPLFDAATYPSLLVATKKPQSNTTIIVHHPNHKSQWTTQTIRNASPNTPAPLSLTTDADSPWLLIPPEVQHAFHTLTSAGIPLATTPLGRPHLGVKSGYNAAFIVHTQTRTIEKTRHTTQIIAPPDKQATIESQSLRPLVRGETLTPWRLQPNTEHIVWTHDPQTGRPLKTLPPLTLKWLSHWQPQLIHRTDARRSLPWWSLFRTNAANPHRSRVIWNDLGKSPSAATIPPNNNTVPLNSCYVTFPPSLDDAYALTALLNSPLIAAWLHILAEPARGGYHRFLGWTMSLIPIPKDWEHAKKILAPIAQYATHTSPPTQQTLLAATLHAFQLHHNQVDELLKWHAAATTPATPA